MINKNVDMNKTYILKYISYVFKMVYCALDIYKNVIYKFTIFKARQIDVLVILQLAILINK